MDVDNGIQNGPQLSVERTPDNWVDAASYPETATATSLKLSATNTNGLGKLGSTAPKAGAAESFTDNPSLSETNWASKPDTANSARVVFSSGTLSSPVTVSGGSTITVTASSASSGQVSAVLVDLGHYASLTSKTTLTPGRSHTMTFKLAPTDHQVAAGHRLALIVGGTDKGWITADSAKPKITLDLTKTSVQVSLIGSLP